MVGEDDKLQKSGLERDEDSLKALLMGLFGSHYAQYVGIIVEYEKQEKQDENMIFDEYFTMIPYKIQEITIEWRIGDIVEENFLKRMFLVHFDGVAFELIVGRKYFTLEDNS
jgi:hypothetical protein